MEALEHRLEATEAALLRLISITDETNLRTAFTGDLQHQSRRITDDSSLRAGSEPEAVKGGTLLAFWEQYPVGTPDEILEWAKVSLNGRSRADHEEELSPYTNLRVPGGEAELEQDQHREVRVDPSLGQGNFLSDEAQASQQLQLEEAWRTGNTPPEQSHHSGHSVHSEQPEHSQAGESDSVDSEAVASRLGVPLEFQRLYVW